MEFKCAEGCDLCCKASSVTVLPHEVYILEKYAEELGVSVTFTPAYKVADLISGSRIALSYLMHLNKSGRCPFLSRGRCSLHNHYKPLTCRSFPYLPKVIKYNLDPVAREVKIDVRFVMSTLCPVVRRDLSDEEVALMHDLSAAFKYAPREAEAALHTLEKRYIYAEILSHLWREGVVDLDDGDKYPHFPILNGFAFIRKIYPHFTIKL